MSEPGGSDPAGGDTPEGWGPPRQTPPGYGQPGEPRPDQPAPQYGQPQYGQPQYGQYGPPQYGQPQYGQYGRPQYGQPQHGGAQRPGLPPVHPGIVPLRPLALGEIFDGAFAAIRHNPKVMVGLSAVVVSLATILATLVGYVAAEATISDAWWQENIVDTELSMYWVPGTAGEFGVLVATLLVMGITLPVVTGLLTYSVSRSVIGQHTSVGQTWRAVRGRIWFLIAFPVLLALAEAVVLALYFLLIAGSAEVDPALGELVLLMGGGGVCTLFVWVGTRTGLVPCALALEGEPFWATVARGWRLTRGVFWRLLGIYLLAYLAMLVISSVLNVPVNLISASVSSDAVYWTIATAWSVVIQLVQTLFMAGVVAFLYIDTRMRREGLDVELRAAAQEAAE